jgi:hypothetical protein
MNKETSKPQNIKFYILHLFLDKTANLSESLALSLQHVNNYNYIMYKQLFFSQNEKSRIIFFPQIQYQFH